MNPESSSQFIPDQEVKSEKVIVTGGTEGIGRAIALELVCQNHSVVICARTQEKLDEMKELNRIEAVQLDLGDTDQIENFVKLSSERIGGVTILILNAAVSGIQETDEYTFRVNIEAQKLLVEAAAPLLQTSNGRVVFLSSPQAEHPVETNLAYGQSKKAVIDWLKSFSARAENKNIHIFSVNPGPVDTKMHEDAIEFGSSELRDRSMQIKTAGRLRNPEIVGRIISKMSLRGKKFNQETSQYNIPIVNNEVVTITGENITYEESLIAR